MTAGETIVFGSQFLLCALLLPGIVFLISDGSWQAVQFVLALFGGAYLCKIAFYFASKQARERREKVEGVWK